MELVFVYGTLRKGEGNHHLLKTSRRVAMLARTKGLLVDTGLGYPAMLQDDSGWVNGELYEVDEKTIIRLDVLEGFYGPNDERNYYDRFQADVVTDRGTVKAWTYIFAELHDRCNPIAEGDWKLEKMCSRPEMLYFAYGSCMDIKTIGESGVPDGLPKTEGRGVVSGCNLQYTRCATNDRRAVLTETGGATKGRLYSVPVEAVKRSLYERGGVCTGCCRPAVVTVQCADGSEKDALAFVAVPGRTVL